MEPQTRPKQVRSGTAEKLLYAAAAEFNEHGFAGTDTNRIARRAGFAPQTFYRWYEDKIEIFIRVYEYWEGLEAAALQGLLAQNATDALVGLYGSEQDKDAKRAIINALSAQRNAKALVEIGRREKDLYLKKEIVRRVTDIKTPEAAAFLEEILK